ncbi:hypothetical protein ACJMK2_028264 [Sinanodonta woodiana]|uniref:Uncharacterized protein n=1 Tax=Sinanodonta woodiana TaxID=1069815 RepID=A0ABD3XAF3_SINWO
MALPDKVHDPLFHFETHFPERLSRLHLNPELSHHVPVARRIRRSRANRQGARYKTQPVTFDEIQEVDEDNLKEEDKVDGEKKSGLKGQFMAFSRSMDGLVTKISRIQKDTIPENEVVGDTKDGQNQSEENENKSSSMIDAGPIKESRLEGDEHRRENKENEPSDVQENSNASLPPIGPHAQHRKQRQTAKAKRRHIQSETESQSSCTNEQAT